MTPTVRAALALAVIGLLALVLTPWFSAALMVMLVAAVAADAFTARKAPRVERTLPQVISRGTPVSVQIWAETRGRPTLLRQPPGLELEVRSGEGAGELQATLVARRRGVRTLPPVACASIGPLGLARVHHRGGEPAVLRVLPDVAGARRLIARLISSRPGLTGGRSRGPLGLGTEFESVREYTLDDDLRAMNWRASARLGRPMTNQYRVERDRDVICVIDCGRLMTAPLPDGATLLDLALDAMTVVALAADELGDRFGVLAFDGAVRREIAPRHRGGAAAVRALFDLEAAPVDSDFETALIQVSRRRRAVAFVFTDLLDEVAGRSLSAGTAVLSRHHAAHIVSAIDPEVERLAAEGEPATALAALQVVSTRRLAAEQLRRAGARIVQAPPERLAAHCLDAYVRAKLAART